MAKKKTQTQRSKPRRPASSDDASPQSGGQRSGARKSRRSRPAGGSSPSKPSVAKQAAKADDAFEDYLEIPSYGKHLEIDFLDTADDEADDRESRSTSQRKKRSSRRRSDRSTQGEADKSETRRDTTSEDSPRQSKGSKSSRRKSSRGRSKQPPHEHVPPERLAEDLWDTDQPDADEVPAAPSGTADSSDTKGTSAPRKSKRSSSRGGRGRRSNDTGDAEASPPKSRRAGSDASSDTPASAGSTDKQRPPATDRSSQDAEQRGRTSRRKKKRPARDENERSTSDSSRAAEAHRPAEASSRGARTRSTEPSPRGGRGSSTEESPRDERGSSKPTKPQTERSDERRPAKATSGDGSRSRPPARRKRDRRADTPFGRLGLSPALLDALAAADYDEPTPIQSGMIPRALAGVDIMGQARTGTGKTAAFAVPILEMLEPADSGAPQALVLVPTRELAVQVRDEFAKIAAYHDARVIAVYGGKPIRKQIQQLRSGTEVVVGTPGRILDLIARGALDLAKISCVVLDEADRMLDIGFRPDIEKILRRCPTPRQTLLLSATLPPPVVRLAQRYMNDPETLDFSANDLAVETIEQYYCSVDPERKFDALLHLLAQEEPRQAIIFCRTKRATERIYTRISKQLDKSAAIHGDLSQSVRDRVMARFREGKIRFLVATDIVGRGIDVSAISHIINYDIPQFCDDYVHRVGRTGRMGREGVAFSLVTPEEGKELTRIEMRINLQLKRAELKGFKAFAIPRSQQEEEEAPPSAAAKPVFGRPVRRVRRAL